VIILPATSDHVNVWAELRYALWPWEDVDDHAEEAAELYLAGHPDRVAFVALDDAGDVIAFAEASLRRDYVEGCETSPVAFLEGVYVKPDVRKSGVARALVDAVADWGRAQDCTECASNVLFDNVERQAFQAAIGFEETERVVYYRREL
jgi:aminoglycoside 6'-N-acetyltransferase I